MEYEVQKIDMKDMPLKIKEAYINTLRQRRNQLLEETDKYMLSDFPITEENKNKMIIYRQNLRDWMNPININIETLSDETINSLPIKPVF